MIRINLLPVKAAKRRELGQRQIYVIALVLLVAVAGLFVFHGIQTSRIATFRKQNASFSDEIETLKKEVGDFDQIKAQREQLVTQRDVIRNLESARSGPVLLLRELSRILTPGGQPTMDTAAFEECVRRDPNCAYNPRWDPRRVVVDSFAESGKHLELGGMAKDNSDVAEFLKRLQLSKHFRTVALERTSAAAGNASQGKFVQFALAADVLYDEGEKK